MSQTKAQLVDTLIASLLPASDSAVDIGSNAVRFANIYGDTLYGNGANLTGINTDLVSDTSPQLGGDLDTNSHNISIDDNHRINFGDSSDLHLIHDGTNSYLQNITGVLYINNTSGTATNLIVKANDNIELQPANGETGVKAIANGSVELYHDNSKKLETTSIGITLFGDLKIPDNEELRLGDGNDLQIYHNGSNSYIDSNTGNLYFRGSNGQMLFRPNNSEDALVLKPNGAVELYYDNSKKLETVSGGIAITGRLDCTQGIDIDANNQAFRVGASQNLQLVYTGSEAQIKQLDASQHLKILVKDGVETSAIFKANGAVELYYDNSKKAETYANGFIAHHHLKVMGAQDQNAVIQMFADEGDNTDDQFLMASEHNPNRWVLLGQYVSGWHRYIQVLPQAGVQLYYDDLDSSSPTAKLATTSTGVAISGNATFTDGNKSIYGNGGDMEIYHIADNTNVIRGSGPLTIQSNDNVNFNTYSGGELMGKFIKNGAFEAYYDNSKKFETNADGARVTGRFDAYPSSSSSVIAGQFYNNSTGASADCVVIIKTYANQGADPYIKFDAGGSDMIVGNKYGGTTNNKLVLGAGTSVSGGVAGLQIDGGGQITPDTNNARDLGSTSLRFRNVYTNDLNLSNEGGTNDIDGTWGSYTIQEGAEDLFLVNKRSGKKYKFNLTEVS